MKILDEQLCKMIAGAHYLSIYPNGVISIIGLGYGFDATINNLEFTDHGYFDLEGNKIHPYTVNGFQIMNGYQIKLHRHESNDPDYYISDIYYSYQLTPV